VLKSKEYYIGGTYISRERFKKYHISVAKPGRCKYRKTNDLNSPLCEDMTGFG
jgi:hypothetical protein